jgi:hypothetical protein
MKLHTVAALAVAVVAGGVGLSADVWAGGAGGGNTSCFVDTSSSLGNPISGTATIHGIPIAGAYNLDAVLRLQKSGQEQVFRVHVPGVQVVSPTGTACDLLAAIPLNASSQTIQAAFGLGNKQLKVTNRSITGLDWINLVPGSGNNMTIVEVTIYPAP